MSLVILRNISKKAVFLAAKIYNLTGGWHEVCVTALSVILFSIITLAEIKMGFEQFIYRKIFWRLLLSSVLN